MIVPIRLKGKAQDIIRRSNVQIFSLDALEPDKRNRFLFGKDKAIVVLERDTFRGRLHSLGKDRISIEFQEEVPPYVKKGHTVVVVLPESSERRYILQARVINRFIHNLELQVLDPRSDRRVVLKDRGYSVDLWKVPETMVQGIAHQHILMVRDINFGIEEF